MVDSIRLLDPITGNVGEWFEEPYRGERAAKIVAPDGKEYLVERAVTRPKTARIDTLDKLLSMIDNPAEHTIALFGVRNDSPEDAMMGLGVYRKRGGGIVDWIADRVIEEGLANGCLAKGDHDPYITFEGTKRAAMRRYGLVSA